MSPQTIKGAEAVLRVLEEEGVDLLFGYPGGSVIPLYDALYDSAIRAILPRHEQGAAHMADGYSRSTGKTGVCMATSGPGATNLTTGLATAYMDSIPMVALTGQVRRTAIGRDSFQEADTTGVTIPVTKHNYLVTEEGELADTVREAFYLARIGRPGPVLVDLPMDILSMQVPWTERDIEGLDGWEEPLLPDGETVEQAAKLINEAERPLLYIGGGVIAAEASELVLQLAEKCAIPVVHTLMGKGGFPETHELSMGMPGMHGMAYANIALHECDLMVVVGARFDDRVTGDPSRFSPGAKVVHIDIDAAEIDKIRTAQVPIVADAHTTLQMLTPLCKPRGKGAWVEYLIKVREDKPLAYKWNGEAMPPQHVLDKLYEVTAGKAIIATEVGQNQMWAAQHYKIDRPRRFLSSGGLGTMGYGFPAAIGAQLGNPDELVVDIAGDGSIQMNIQEMATARINQAPVKVVILNNGYLGMVRQWQELFFDRRYSGVELPPLPDFVKLAEAYDSAGFDIDDPDQVVPALEQALEISDRPVLMNFRVAQEANVFPMIPAGRTIDEMMLEEPGN